MRKYIIVLIAAAAFLVSTMPVSADTAFNDMSKCIQSWGKEGASAPSTTAATQPKPKTSTDAIGNVIPTGTDNSGKTLLGQ